MSLSRTDQIAMQQESSGGFLRKFLIIFVPIAVILGFIVGTIVLISVLKKPEEKKRSFNTLAVVADYAVRDTVQLKVRTQGEARPRTEIDLVPQVGGNIVYISPNFVEGGVFRKGEVLARVEDADYDVAVIRAEAQVAQAEQVLVREMAEAEIARQDYAELGQSDTPSALALRKPQQAQAQAALQAAQADLGGAKLNLSRTAIIAPFDGRIRTTQTDIGQFVTPGRTLARIFSTDIIQVRLPLTDPDLAKLDIPIAFVAEDRESAPRVQLTAIVGGQLQTWDGRIMRTDSTYDTQTRALFAFAEVFDPYGKGASDNGVPLPPGLFLDANINGKNFDNVIVIPRDGLRPQNEVYVVDDKGKAEIRKVSLLDANPDRAVLTGGIEAGELIILSPMERSRVEMTLKVLDANNPEIVLVEPPEPDWMKKAKAGEGAAEGDDKKNKRRGKKDDADDAPLKKSDTPKRGQPDTADASDTNSVKKVDTEAGDEESDR